MRSRFPPPVTPPRGAADWQQRALLRLRSSCLAAVMFASIDRSNCTSNAAKAAQQVTSVARVCFSLPPTCLKPVPAVEDAAQLRDKAPISSPPIALPYNSATRTHHTPEETEGETGGWRAARSWASSAASWIDQPGALIHQLDSQKLRRHHWPSNGESERALGQASRSDG